MSKSVFKIATVLSTAVAATIITAVPKASADGASERTIALSPVTYEQSGIDYLYLDAPKSIFADAAGMIVAERNAVDYITKDADGYAVSAKRDIAADKAARIGECLVTVKNGAFEFRYGDGVTEYAPDSPAVDFTLANNSLYVLFESSLAVIPFDGETSTFDTNSARTIEFVSDEYAYIETTAITVCNGDIFVAANSAVFEDKQDICALNAETGVLTPAIMQSDKVLAVTSLDAQSTVYALTRDKITAYYDTNGSLQVNYSASGADMSKIHAYDGFVYALGSLNSVCRFSHDLQTRTTLACSAGNDAGFFNMPIGLAAKNSVMYVADSINDRIVEFAGDKPTATVGEFKNPVSVASDNGGTLYVAHDVNKISVIAPNGDETRTLTSDGTVKQIAVDASKNIYALTDRGLFVARRDAAELVKISSTKYKAIALGLGKYELFALDGAVVVKITFDADGQATVTDHATVGADAFSITVDLDGNVFALSRTAIVRTDGTTATKYALTEGDAAYSLGFTRGHITICTVENEFFDYGDIVISDTYKHRLFAVDGSADGLNVKCVDGSYETPDIAGSSTPDAETANIIRTVLRDTSVFPKPAETPPLYTVSADCRVIVPQYDIADFPEYSFVVIEKLDGNGKPVGELVQGYVYKEALSAPLPYAAPPENYKATAYGRFTPVYKFPTPSAKALDGAGLAQDTSVTLLDFVADYIDDYGNRWYRIRIGENCDGYVMDKYISLNGYEPVFIRPAYDAEIIEYDGETFAQAYFRNGDEYTAIDGVVFEVGTQVEVVGIFDTSEQYTQVKYLDPERGTLTCYVRTVHLKYKGVNIVPIVAWIVIAITLLLAIVIIARVFYIKRKRLASLPNE